MYLPACLIYQTGGVVNFSLFNAFKYGAPPHGGIAFGLDRLAAVLKGKDVIRDFIAFPKNNSGKDLMIDAPSRLTKEQLKDLSN